jgi:hypothetical protein
MKSTNARKSCVKGVWKCLRVFCALNEWIQKTRDPNQMGGLKKAFIWNLHGTKEFLGMCGYTASKVLILWLW